MECADWSALPLCKSGGKPPRSKSLDWDGRSWSAKSKELNRGFHGFHGQKFFILHSALDPSAPSVPSVVKSSRECMMLANCGAEFFSLFPLYPHVKNFFTRVHPGHAIRCFCLTVGNVTFPGLTPNLSKTEANLAGATVKRE
jgi:hypothetical protein